MCAMLPATAYCSASRENDNRIPVSGRPHRGTLQSLRSDSDGARRAETFSTNVPLPHKPDLLMAEARPMRASAYLAMKHSELKRWKFSSPGS
jgi:hypothetical protein